MTTLFAAVDDGLFIVTQDGDDWDPRVRLQDHDLQCVAASHDVPDRVFCGSFSNGLFRSTDRGSTFSRVGTNVLDDPIMAIAIDPTDPDTIWVGTEPSAIYRSVDAGETWDHIEGLTSVP